MSSGGSGDSTDWTDQNLKIIFTDNIENVNNALQRDLRIENIKDVIQLPEKPYASVRSQILPCYRYMRNIIRQVQEPLEHPSKIWLWLMRSVSAIFSFSVHAFCFLCALSNVSQIWQRQLNIHISFKLNFLTENSLNSILNLMKSHSGTLAQN